jgi:hypothetical protein
MRVLALVCLLLVGTASSVQAVHIHGEWLPQAAAHAQAPADASQTPGGEEHCPLCVAMHSSLPTSTVIALVSAPLSQASLASQSSPSPDSPWHFAAFSRPPPVRSFSS